MPKIADIKSSLPELQGLDDEQALNVIHEVYYPTTSKAELAARLGVNPAKPPVEEGGNFGRGFNKAMIQIPQTIGGAIALGGDLAGADGVRDYGMQMYDANAKKAEALTRDTDSFSHVLENGGEGTGKFLAHGAGYVTGQALTSVATGGIGGFIGSQLAKRGIKEVVARGAESAMAKQVAGKVATNGAKIGAGAGLFGSNLVQEAGSIYPEAVEEAHAEGRELDGIDKARVVGSAVVAAGVDTAMDAVMAGRVLAGGRKVVKDPKSGLLVNEGYLKAGAREVPGAMAREGVTEGIQTAIERYGAGQELSTADAIRDYVDSMALGALGGGMGGAASLLHAQKVPESGPLTRAANAGTEDKVLQLTNDQEPFIVFPDGSTGRKSEMEAYLASLPEEQQITERARLLGMGPQKLTPEEKQADVYAVEHANSQENIRKFSEMRAPESLEDAYRKIQTPGGKQSGLAIVPHAYQDGFTLLPTKMLSIEDQVAADDYAKQAADTLKAREAEAKAAAKEQNKGVVPAETGYGKTDELASLVEQEKTDLHNRRTDYLTKDKTRRESELEAIGARVDHADQVKSTRARFAILDAVLGDAALDTPDRRAKKFAAELKRAGYANNAIRPDEQAHIERHAAIEDAFGNDQEPSLPNEMDVAALIPEKKPKPPAPKPAAVAKPNSQKPVAAVPDTVLNPKGEPFKTEFAAKKKLRDAALMDSHEVVKVESDDGFVLKKKAQGQEAFEAAAHEAATSPANDLPEPTPAQKEAGNYKVGRVKVHGLDISIENPAGSVRKGVDRDGKAWENTLEHHYGYIKGTVGADKDHIDTFINGSGDSDRVFVVDQVHPDTGAFDEHKVIFGAGSAEEARAIYQANYAKDWQGGKDISETSVEGFKAWLKDGDTKKPFAKAAEPKKDEPPAFHRKLLADMTDDELRSAQAYYAPEHARSPKIEKEMNKRGMTAQPDTPATAAPAASAEQRNEETPGSGKAETSQDTSAEKGKGDNPKAPSEAEKSKAPALQARDAKIAEKGETPQGAATEQPKPAPAKSEPAPTAKKPSSGAQVARDRLKAENPFLAFLAADGIAMEDKADAGMDRGNAGNRMVPGFGPIFRKTGPRLDVLALRAQEEGFLTQDDIDNPNDAGGTRKLADMIQRAVAGKEIIQRAATADDAAERAAQQMQDDDLLREASQAGIDADGKSLDQVYDEVVAHHAAGDAALITDDTLDAMLELAFHSTDEQPYLTDAQLDEIFGPAKKSEGAHGAEEGTRTDARGRGEEDRAGPGDFSLAGETVDEAKARVVAEEDGRKAKQDADSDANQRAQADAEVGSFTLTGSDRAADVGAAQGQKDIFSQPDKKQKTAKDAIREVAKARPFDAFDAVRGDVIAAIKDQTGKSWSEHEELRGSMMREPLAEAIHDGQYEGMQEYAADLPVRISESAIPLSSAVQAFSGTSHSPEQRGRSAQRTYFRQVMHLWKQFEQAYNDAPTDRQEAFVDAFNEIASRYASMTNAYLSAHSRVVSSMIAGPARFPTESNRKKSDTADRRANEATEYLNNAPKRLMKMLHGPVDNSLASQIKEAESRLAAREEAQEQYRAINAALRKKDDQPLRDMGFSDTRIAELKKPDFAGRTGIPDYQLKNNNAEIRRLRDRVEELKRRATDAEATQQDDGDQEQDAGPGPRMVRNAEANRLQLFFDGKPDESIRTQLKEAGFRWSPTNGAWQRQLTDNAVQAAKKIIDSMPGEGPIAGRIADDTIEIDGKQRPTVNSEGKQIAYTSAGLRDFWKWFADSKVVDEQGRPLVVYHGTANGKFEAFDINRAGDSTDAGYYGRGFYFSADRQVAQNFAGAHEKSHIVDGYMALQKPLVFNRKQDRARLLRSLVGWTDKELQLIDADARIGEDISGKRFTEILRANGYDGVIVNSWKVEKDTTGKPYNADAPMVEIVALDPTQIKSVDNIGTFNSSDARIMYAQDDHISATPEFDLELARDVGAQKPVDELLAKIEEQSVNPQHRELAKALRAQGLKTTFEIGSAKGRTFAVAGDSSKFAAGYQAKTDKAYLFRLGNAEQNILHELVHAATMRALRKGGLGATQMKALYQHVQKSGAANGLYGMENLDEFVAEAFSNRRFQTLLRDIPAMRTGSRFKNAWDQFVAMVKRLLGFDVAQMTALEQVLEAGRNLMDENHETPVKRTEAAAFKAWFGNSKVVDSKGKPLVVYHGTQGDFSTFKPTTQGQFGPGIYTTASPQEGGKYASATSNVGDAPNVMPVFVSLQNPLIVEADVSSGAPRNWFKQDGFNQPGDQNNIKAVERLISEGYDGVIARQPEVLGLNDDGSLELGPMQTHYIAFRPEQIKSATGNSGNFDPTNPDITGNGNAREQRAQELGYTVKAYRGVSRSNPFPEEKVFATSSQAVARAYSEEVQDYDDADVIEVYIKPDALKRFDMRKITDDELAQQEPDGYGNPQGYGIYRNADDSPLGNVQHTVYVVPREQAKTLDDPLFDDDTIAGNVAQGVDSFLNTLGVQETARNKVSDLFQSQKTFNGFWHKTVGTQYHKAQIDHHFKRVYDAAQRYLSTVSLLANEAADAAPTLLPKLEGLRDLTKKPAPKVDVEAAGRAIFEGTLNDAKVYSDAELKDKFKLTPAQIGLYREFRAATDKSLDDMGKTDILRYAGTDGKHLVNQVIGAKTVNDGAALLAEHLESIGKIEAAEVIRDKAEKIAGLKLEGYAPLMRFGEHTVYVTDDKGNQLFFGMAETAREAAALARDMKETYPKATVTQGILSTEGAKLFSGISPDTIEVFAKTTGLDKDPLFQDYLKLVVNNRSALKRLIHRKGVAGFSQDTTRVLASFLTSNARASSKNLHGGEMTQAANDIPKTKGDVRDEAIRLVDYIQNPIEEAAKIRGLLFTNFIGGSIASAMVNMTQPITMTLPYLAQFGGAGKATAALLSAMKQAVLPDSAITDKALRDAMHQAEREGVVSPQEIHNLQAEAMRSSRGIEIGGKQVVPAFAMRKLAVVWGGFFGLAEQFNRKATFIAAYQIAQKMTPKQFEQAGVKDAYAFAVKAIAETQGTYNKGNKANWARGAIGSTLMTFRQYGIHYLEFLSRLPNKEKALALAILMAASGAQGLPFSDDLDDIIETIAQALGYNFNSKKAKERFVTNILGEGGAAFVMNGVSGVGGMPIDVSIRMGMGNLLPATGMFKKSETDKSRQYAEILGAAGGFSQKVVKAGDKLLDGDPAGAAMAVAATAIQNAAKAVDMMQNDMYRDTRGRKVIDTDPVDALVKGIGFQPSNVAREQDKMNEARQDIAVVKAVKMRIADQWAQGVFDKDPEATRKARESIGDWNRKNPESKINITTAQVAKRVHEMRLEKSARMIKTAPKEMRAGLRDELE